MGIVGYGFVGKATDFGFDTPLVNKFVVDPIYGSTVDEMCLHFKPDIVFVSVPTPMGSDGSIDSSIIKSVFYDLQKNSLVHAPIVVIKSTITPNVIQELEKIYSRIVYNPEFLTERNANLDFIHAPFLLLGGRSRPDLWTVEEIYAKYSQCDPCPVYKVDLEAASMIKYTINSFMATKVLFFNQINDIYRNCGTSTSWEDFISVMLADPRVGYSHMSVPGPDGKRGFGGACFPKDAAALIRYARDVGTSFTALEEVVRANQLIRSQYTDLDQREKEQNVRFDVL